MYFVLGMLSIIAAAIVSVLVWGIVKTNKQQLWLDNIQRQMEQASREVNDRFSEVYRDMDQRGSWMHQRIDQYDAKLHDRIDRESAEVNRRIDETHSYIDSRIDKATSGNNGAKQVIKG